MRGRATMLQIRILRHSTHSTCQSRKFVNSQARPCRILARPSPCVDTPSYKREEQRHPLGADDPNTSVDNDLGEHYIKSTRQRIPGAENKQRKHTFGIIMLHHLRRHRAQLVHLQRFPVLQICSCPHSSLHLLMFQVQVQPSSFERRPQLLRATHATHFQHTRKVDHTRDRTKAVLHG